MNVGDFLPDARAAVAEAGRIAADWNAGSTTVNLLPASMMVAPAHGAPGDDSHMTTWVRVVEMILPRRAAEAEECQNAVSARQRVAKECVYKINKNNELSSRHHHKPPPIMQRLRVSGTVRRNIQ